MAKQPVKSSMSLAEKIRKLREAKGLSLDDLADKAGISKTYLWELERDAAGTKKPSADVLMRIATALSTTLADLLSLETVKIQETAVELSPSLKDFQRRMAAQSTPLTPEDLRDLAVMKFRGGQPQTADEWHQLYLLLVNSTRRKKS
ncbi:MAG: helix-turn-helix transcriptional regulator [Planctomycetota bacterium]